MDQASVKYQLKTTTEMLNRQLMNISVATNIRTFLLHLINVKKNSNNLKNVAFYKNEHDVYKMNIISDLFLKIAR